MVPALILLVAIPVIIAIAAASNSAAKRRAMERRQALIIKYGGNTMIVDKILRQLVWQGQTPEMLRDSWGLPLDIDHKVLKTKRKEVWKYNRLGTNRYGSRVTLENGTVVGWDIK